MLWRRLTHKPIPEETLIQPEGVTQLFYRERLQGKHHNDPSHLTPLVDVPETTPRKP
jgi:hypothetical protein